MTLKKLSSPQSGTLGELLTVAKLNTLGLAAYMSPEGAPGHDVIVVVDGQPKSVEVKTRQFLRRSTEIMRWPVEWHKKGDADFFVFIELDLRTMAPTFYVLTNEQARGVRRDYEGGRQLLPAIGEKADQAERLLSAGIGCRGSRRAGTMSDTTNRTLFHTELVAEFDRSLAIPSP